MTIGGEVKIPYTCHYCGKISYTEKEAKGCIAVPVRFRDFPKGQVQPRECIERAKQLIKENETKYPVIYEGEINGKPARVRGMINNDNDPLGYCEYLYEGNWCRLLNVAMCDELKKQCKTDCN